MFDVVHSLAKEYGWSKKQILEEVYVDEIEYYLKRIRKDQANDRLTELAIVHNPNAKDPNKLIASFKKALQELEGKAYLAKDKMTKEDEQNLREIARRMKANAEKRRRG
ncbi:hypothetical protein [Terrihalobacillus insolitus]|uniref:hypothetical protein n=1 Tax=Terrihalobacillus insolitus TaxID=2950438 RepID=UPI002342374A|nr:hypothetical protein [Terrihalobacillus insolitus]MDC3413958.1 hypothetical protein [Terrihalobacillus insolitus]